MQRLRVSRSPLSSATSRWRRASSRRRRFKPNSSGKAFTAATTSGTKFKMTFSSDGKVTREPQDKAGAKGEGTWKLSKDGFCTTWKGSAANCYTIVNVDKNKWSVVKGAATVAVWSK